MGKSFKRDRFEDPDDFIDDDMFEESVDQISRKLKYQDRRAVRRSKVNQGDDD